MTQYTYTPTKAPDPDVFRNGIRCMGIIIALNEDGKSHQEIADWLNEEGFLYDPDTPWKPDMVATILKKLDL